MRLSRRHIRAVVTDNTPDLLRYFLRRVPLPEDAADLLGETLLVVWKRAEDLPADPVEARMWMFGIARNVLLTHHRSLAKQTRLGERLREEFGRNSDDAQADVESRLELEAALRAIDDDKRELVLLVHGEGFTVAEAGRILDLNPSTARSRYAAALAQLRIALGATAPSPRVSVSSTALIVSSSCDRNV